MITFSTQGVEMPLIDKNRINRWINGVAADYGYRIGHLNYILCSDERELEVNRQFLQHDYYTDVITFDYSDKMVLSGDIFISLDFVRASAEEIGTEFDDELRRILIHGVLHLTGQADKTPETKAEMTRKENLALAKW